MEEQQEISIIILGDKSKEFYLLEIGITGREHYELELHFSEKRAPIAEYLVSMVRSSFGWIETDRGRKNVINKGCWFERKRFCTNEKVKRETGQIKCTGPVRTSCQYFKKKFGDHILVNYVTLEKVGAIRDM